MSYQIKGLGERVSAASTIELVNRLSEINGSVSVILEGGQSVCNRVVFVDVAEGVIRQSYGDQKVLKAADFEVGGRAFS